MSARITLKQALEQIEALRHNLNLVETERDSLRAELASRPAAPQRSTFVRRGPTPEQQAAHDAYLSALANAKALAMKTGRSVVVGG